MVHLIIASEVSANAYVQWDAGPSLVVTYTKPADATAPRTSLGLGLSGGGATGP